MIIIQLNNSWLNLILDADDGNVSEDDSFLFKSVSASIINETLIEGSGK